MLLSRILPAATLLLIPSLAFASFSDVPSNHPNADAIAYVKAEAIVEGYSDGTFRPDQAINRAEFVKIITLSTFTDDEMRFCDGYEFFDTSSTAWYLPYICVAKKNKIIEGYPDGRFYPDRLINFVEAAKILFSSFHRTDDIDFSKASPWYRPFVERMASASAIPLSIRSFDQRITRGEIAEMIFRLKAGVAYKPSQTYEDLK